MIRRVILVGAASVALASCGDGRPVVSKPPVALLTCADEPVAPDLPGRDQQAARDELTLEYVLSLRSAWGDCFAKIAGVRAWANEMERK